MQTPEMETKTLYIDQVADKVWFVIGENESRSIYIDDLEEPVTPCLDTGRLPDE